MNNTLHLVLDETSAMHLKHEQYFIIGGYLIDNINYIKSKCKKIETHLKINNQYINNLIEIKGTKLKSNHLIEYISFISKNSKSFIPVSILIDKDKLSKKNWNENETFNFFVKWLVNYLIKYKIINCEQYKEVIIHMDNRNISTNFNDALATHLNLYFFNYKIKFSVMSKYSKKYYEIRGADIICYALYRIFNKPNTNKTKQILDYLKVENIDLLKYQSLFPLK